MRRILFGRLFFCCNFVTIRNHLFVSNITENQLQSSYNRWAVALESPEIGLRQGMLSLEPALFVYFLIKNAFTDVFILFWTSVVCRNYAKDKCHWCWWLRYVSRSHERTWSCIEPRNAAAAARLQLCSTYLLTYCIFVVRLLLACFSMLLVNHVGLCNEAY